MLKIIIYLLLYLWFIISDDHCGLCGYNYIWFVYLLSFICMCVSSRVTRRVRRWLLFWWRAAVKSRANGLQMRVKTETPANVSPKILTQPTYFVRLRWHLDQITPETRIPLHLWSWVIAEASDRTMNALSLGFTPAPPDLNFSDQF